MTEENQAPTRPADRDTDPDIATSPATPAALAEVSPPEETGTDTPDTPDLLPHEKNPEHVYDAGDLEAYPSGTKTVTLPDGSTVEDPILYRHQDGRLEPHPWQKTSRS